MLVAFFMSVLQQSPNWLHIGSTPDLVLLSNRESPRLFLMATKKAEAIPMQAKHEKNTFCRPDRRAICGLPQRFRQHHGHPNRPIPTVNVQASLYGRVVTEGGIAVIGATVKVVGQTLTTNNGLFFVYNQQLNHNGTYVQVKAPGYIATGRFAYPHLGSSTYMEIVVSDKSYQNFSTETTANIPLNGGASVTIPAQSLVTANGQIYSGTFVAATRWLDPNDAATFTLMPGDLRAEDADGNARILKTFGMLGVESTTATGESLNLAPNKKATISLPIPAVMRGNAPNTIPLWHFDENNGYWKEEGSATKEGNNYVGEVSHFSFWNCDVPADYILLDGCLGNAPAGTPLANAQITLTSVNYGTGYGYTDGQGLFGAGSG